MKAIVNKLKEFNTSILEERYYTKGEKSLYIYKDRVYFEYRLFSEDSLEITMDYKGLTITVPEVGNIQHKAKDRITIIETLNEFLKRDEEHLKTQESKVGQIKIKIHKLERELENIERDV